MSVSGFTGADCSVVADLPPIVRQLITPPTCSMRDSKCSSLRIIAENFDMRTPITCKLVRIELDISDSGVTRVSNIAGTFSVYHSGLINVRATTDFLAKITRQS